MVICVDIGGGTTRVGFSKDKKNFESIIKFATFENFSDQTQRIVDEIKDQSNVEKIMIGCAGSLDRKNGIVAIWGQRRSWWGQSLFQPLRKIFPNTKLILENDADMAALGEAIFGAGKNNNLVGYVTLSSGIGGGLIQNKKIMPEHFGIEPGHQIVNFKETETWSCGQRGCFESYASGTAFKIIFGLAAENCNDKTIWSKYAKFAAVGLANILVLWSPEIMVIGGGLSNKFKEFEEPLKLELTKLLPIFKIPLIVKAELNEPGLFGGLACL